MASSNSYTHRKLLISSNSTTNPTIQTCLYFCNTTTLKNDNVLPLKFCPTSCLNICPSICQYSLLPRNNYPTQTNTPHNLSPLLISMLILLASCFLLITFYVLYTKLYSHFYHFTPTNPTPQTREGDDEPRGNTVFHPIWYIPTVGLNQKVIDCIKVCKYEKGFVESDCAVCLGEFLVGDEFRVLPKCNHAFHVHCIDTWLMSHVTCPLCRAPVDMGIHDQGSCQTGSTTTIIIRDERIITENSNDESPREDVTDNNNNDNDNDINNSNLENSKEVREENKGSSSQRWTWERGAASLVSRSLSCSGKIFSSRYNNRPSPNS